jgi:hypothetical protein
MGLYSGSPTSLGGTEVGGGAKRRLKLRRNSSRPSASPEM